MNKDIIYIKQLFNSSNVISKVVTVCGWVKSFRSNKFITVNDGTTVKNLQIVIDRKKFNKKLIKKITIGSCLKFSGLIVKSLGQQQKIELIPTKITFFSRTSSVDINKTILQPKKHSLKKLREQAHLRFRTSIFASIMRVRSLLSYAIHVFFQQQNFINIQTPIITSIDSEGIGDTFKVTSCNSTSRNKNFFKQSSFLTVSGQLQAEAAALGLNKIYTFGPVFRAENSNTYRHLSEFWMVEPEMVFFNLKNTIGLAETFLKFIINYVINKSPEELFYLNDYYIDNNENFKFKKLDLINSLKLIIDNDFIKMSYDDSINILKSSKKYKNNEFFYPVKWGLDLQSEHEKFLVDNYSQGIPLVICNYPTKIKSFYMRLNNDNNTVAAMDILFPHVGEIIGGSEREHRYDFLLKQAKIFSIDINKIWWYIETRILGSAPHSGFGMGFDRLVQFITGMNNIRDVVPFPRTPDHAEF